MPKTWRGMAKKELERRLKKGETLTQIAKRLGVSKQRMSMIARKWGINVRKIQETRKGTKKGKWTPEEDRVLRENLNLTDVELGQMLGRTEMAVRRRRHRLGLKKKQTPRWTEKEIRILTKNLHLTDRELRLLLSRRTRAAIMTKRRKLGLLKQIHKSWTEKEEKILRTFYLKKTDDELAKILNRTVSSIRGKRGRLGLKRR